MANNALEELTHQEVHFIAEDEEILVVPNFSLPQVHLLGGTVRLSTMHSEASSLLELNPPLGIVFSITNSSCSVLGVERPCAEYGPFRPQIPVGVPLWLAMILKKQGKCNVIPPRWLDVTTLNSVIELERGDDVFQALPFHYIELATDLCKYAREDLQDWSLSYDLMDSIRSVRHNKIQKGLRELDASALKGVNLSQNLTAMEVNIIRPFMSSALDHFLDANGNA